MHLLINHNKNPESCVYNKSKILKVGVPLSIFIYEKRLSNHVRIKFCMKRSLELSMQRLRRPIVITIKLWLCLARKRVSFRKNYKEQEGFLKCAWNKI